MARSVCKGDPRTIDSRRADAVGALACGESALSCQCDAPACQARQNTAKGSNGVLVHVIANASTLAGAYNKPGFADRLGVIDADLTRRIAGVPRSPSLSSRHLTWEQKRTQHIRLARHAESMRKFAAEAGRKYGLHKLRAAGSQGQPRS